MIMYACAFVLTAQISRSILIGGMEASPDSIQRVDSARSYYPYPHTAAPQRNNSRGLAAPNSDSLEQISITEGLAAYYPFHGNANDESGNRRDGDVHGATLTVDRFGNDRSACQFNAGNDFILLSHGPYFQLRSELTVCGWVNPQGFNSGECQSNDILHFGKTNDEPGAMEFGYGDGGDCDEYNPDEERFSFGMKFVGTGFTTLTGTTIVRPAKWYFVACTFDGSSMKLYVDGVLEKSQPAVAAFKNARSSVTIGRSDNDDIPSPLKGILDDIRIYNRALNAQEIRSLYKLR